MIFFITSGPGLFKELFVILVKGFHQILLKLVSRFSQLNYLPVLILCPVDRSRMNPFHLSLPTKHVRKEGIKLFENELEV